MINDCRDPTIRVVLCMFWRFLFTTLEVEIYGFIAQAELVQKNGGLPAYNALNRQPSIDIHFGKSLIPSVRTADM